MASLAGKVALITGGTKGIGRATAQLLAKNGATIAVNYSSDSASADSLVSELGADKCLAIQGDAGDVASCEAMVKSTVDKFGKIDVLIPNAGVLMMKNLEATTEADFDTSHRLNVKGPYFLAQKAVPFMPEGSHIIFLSTSLCTASTVSPGYLLYNSTKGAVEQMTRVMAKDLAPKGIRVNAIAPGPTATELFLKGKPEPLLKTIAGFSPFNRIGEPDEIAQGMLWLAR